MHGQLMGGQRCLVVEWSMAGVIRACYILLVVQAHTFVCHMHVTCGARQLSARPLAQQPQCRQKSRFFADGVSYQCAPLRPAG